MNSQHPSIHHMYKKNEDILGFACKWMELENIILSEVTQTQKGMHVLIRGYQRKAQNTQDTTHRPYEALQGKPKCGCFSPIQKGEQNNH